jgi:hypothetical protein
MLAQPQTPEAWAGHAYHRRLRERRLFAACQIAYVRTAFVADGPARLTLDRRIIGIPTRDWTLEPLSGGRTLLAGRVILELKYRSIPPAMFKNLLAEMKLSPCSVSKYRLCWEAWGGPKAHA